MAAELNSTGAEALRRARIIMPSAGPISGVSGMGAVTELRPGFYDPDQQLFIVGQYSGRAWYLHDRGLWSCPLGDFVLGYQLGQITGQVYRQTRWIIPAARAVTAFSMAVASGIAGAIAIVATVAVTGAKVTNFYMQHQEEMDALGRQLSTIVRVLRWIGEHAPVTHRQLMDILGTGFREALRSVPDGIDISDVGAMLGALLGSLIGSHSSAGAVGGFSLRACVRVLAQVVKKGVTRMPAMAARGAQARGRTVAESYIRELRAAGATVSGVDASAILAEFERLPGLEGKLDELHDAMVAAEPLLMTLAEAFRVEAMPDLTRGAPARSAP